MRTPSAAADDITRAAVRSAESAPDPRFRAVMTALIEHLHAFVREVELTPAEWRQAIDFLTRTGQACTELRQEFILLSDTLGVSMLVDAVANPKPPPATESSVLGPFYTTDAPEIPNGATIARGAKGELALVRGRVRDLRGKPIPGARIEVWETDGEGFYDTQYAQRGEPDYRAALHADDAGRFWFRAVKPVSYPIPTDGPAGEMLRALNRAAMRPAHLHVKLAAAGFAPLVTALYSAGDPYIGSDAVFGVRPSLVVVYEPYDAARHGPTDGEPPRWVVEHDFVLADA